jgi:hypothetical protein
VAQEHKPVSTIAVTWMAASIGLLTFLIGIGMLILVFTWAHETLSGIDQALAAVHIAKPVQAPVPPLALAPGVRPAKPDAKPAPKPGPASPPPASVTANPGGPSLTIVAVGLLLKLVGLLVLGILAGIVAARGAHMVASALRPPAMAP